MRLTQSCNFLWRLLVPRCEFGGGASTPAPPPPPPPPVIEDTQAKAQDTADAFRRRKGFASTVLTQGTQLGTMGQQSGGKTASTTLLGGGS